MRYLVAVTLCALASVLPAQAEHTRVTNPSAITLELLGRGLLYSVSFDRVLSDDFAAGLGIGSTNLSGSGSATMIPAYANYYFAREQGSLYATGGVTLVTGDGISTAKSSFGGIELNNVIPTFGVGYENRSDAGFLFRLTGYGLIGNKFSPWVGFTFGYSF